MDPSPRPAAAEQLECVLRLPLPDPASTRVAMTVMKVEPAVPGTTKQVQLCPEDLSRCTLEIVLRSDTMRSLRAAVGAALEQAKLTVRTMRLYPPLPAA